MTIGCPNRPMLAAVTLLALAATAGCGKDDKEDDTKDAAASKVSVEVTEPSKGRYELKAPTSVEAGVVEVSLKNGAKAPADAQIYRVDGGHSAKELVEKVLESPDGAPTPDWAHAAGGVGRTAPGKTGFAAQILDPGSYYILDAASGEEENAKSHAANGAVAALQVAGEAKGALPATGATITAGAPQEYRFTSKGLKAGTNRLTYDNKGKQPHHVVAFPFRGDATLEQVKAAFMSEGEPKGPPPVDFEGARGTVLTDGGRKIVTDLELERGRYALVCFVSDRKGGPPHVAKGMIAEAKVK